jgi:hypothetical protein
MSNYQPKVYLEQGGNRQVIAAGGELLIEGAIRGLIKGRAFYVDSATGSNSNDGTSWTRAVATIDYAIGLCTADRGDFIFVAPGHTETVAAAAGLAVDVAGVSIVGIGRGSKQPKIDFTTATTATVTMSAANCTLENFQLESSFADVASQIVVTGVDCAIRSCRFLEPTVDENSLINILTGAANLADGLVVEGCEFRGLDAANTCGISHPNAQARVVHRNNLFLGVFETGAIKAAGVLAQCAILENYVNNTSGDADECIIIADTSTGVVARNVVGNSLAGNATTNINCGTTMTMAENYSTDKGDVQGVLDPVAT